MARRSVSTRPVARHLRCRATCASEVDGAQQLVWLSSERSCNGSYRPSLPVRLRVGGEREPGETARDARQRRQVAPETLQQPVDQQRDRIAPPALPRPRASLPAHAAGCGRSGSAGAPARQVQRPAIAAQAFGQPATAAWSRPAAGEVAARGGSRAITAATSGSSSTGAPVEQLVQQHAGRPARRARHPSRAGNGARRRPGAMLQLGFDAGCGGLSRRRMPRSAPDPRRADQHVGAAAESWWAIPARHDVRRPGPAAALAEQGGGLQRRRQRPAGRRATRPA